MTIIMTDGQVMVGDGRKIWCGDIVSDSEDKIVRREGRLYGFAGTAALKDPIIEWHVKGADPDKVPKSADEGGWSMLVLEAPGKLWRFTSNTPYPEPFGFPMGAGSGVDIAIGAMLAGASAIEAVEIVCKRVPGCGGKITMLHIDPEAPHGQQSDDGVAARVSMDG
jgi:hypothetical protein